MYQSGRLQVNAAGGKSAEVFRVKKTSLFALMWLVRFFAIHGGAHEYISPHPSPATIRARPDGALFEPKRATALGMRHPRIPSRVQGHLKSWFAPSGNAVKDFFSGKAG